MTTNRLIILLTLILINFSAHSQCDPLIYPPVSLGNDTTVCNGSIFLLSEPGYDTYDWSTGSTNSTILVSTANTYSLTVTQAVGNVIVNGDFESGNTGFTTDYTQGTGGSFGVLSSEGTFDISTSPSLSHSNFTPCADQTTGNGNMLIVNGAVAPSTSVWCQTVTIVPNTEYTFSYWVTNALNNAGVAQLLVNINGAAVGTTNSPSVNGCSWQHFSVNWNSGTATSADICIENQFFGNDGNDFALDDITLSTTCTSTDDIVVTYQNPSQTTTLVQPTCNGVSDGEIHITNTLATQYSFDGGTTYQTDSFQLNLPGGTYNVCSKTSADCEVCESVELVNPPTIDLIVSNDTTICENGSAVLMANSQINTPLNYTWSQTTDMSNTQTITPTATAVYDVFATDQNGCISNTSSILVTVNPPISGSLSPDISICPYETIPLTATANGGNNGPFNFVWSSGQNENGTQSIIDASGTTTYTVTVTDGCESTPFVQTVTVTNSPLPIPSFTILENEICEPAVFELTCTTDPTLIDQISWNVNDEVTNNQTTINTQSFEDGVYTIDLMITSPANCTNSITFIDTLIVIPQAEANFTFGPTPVTMFNTEVNFTNASSNATTYSWSFTSGDPMVSTLVDPTSMFPDGETGSYDVQLIATSEFGCNDTITKPVNIVPEVILYAPNTFTPDDDEFNQTWKIYLEGVDIYEFDLFIYNRWGEIIYESHDASAAWDGTYNGTIVPEGTYTWTMRTKEKTLDNRLTFSGYVLVLK